MRTVCFYFQVHQPMRIRRDFGFFDVGTGRSYEDDEKNRALLLRIAEKCYLPANRLLLELIERHAGAFRISFSVSGLALDQFRLWAPEVLDSFRALARTGYVEFLAETYYHSLAWLFSEAEFRRQVRMHAKAVEELFGLRPRTFRNTELIYEDRLAPVVEELGFRAVLAEGADKVLSWRSPGYVYRPPQTARLKLLLKNYRLSDDIAFRFSDRSWSGWPLTADKYARWLDTSLADGQTANLFMDYETFGEHQWADSGIFEFLRHLPAAVLSLPQVAFQTPGEVAKTREPVAELTFPVPVSWADSERDLSAWLGNPMQDAAARHVFGLEKRVLATRDAGLIHAWRKLQTSDHFYYRCTKFWADGDVHKYFSPFESPYDAYIAHANALNDLRAALEARERAAAEERRQRAMRRLEGSVATGALPATALSAPREAD